MNLSSVMMLSTDTTYDIIAAFARSAPFEVRLFREYSYIGRIANFEKAISHCTKDILFLSDADDVWRERKIQRMLQAFQSAPTIAGVFCDCRMHGGLSPRPLRGTGGP